MYWTLVLSSGLSGGEQCKLIISYYRATSNIEHNLSLYLPVVSPWKGLADPVYFWAGSGCGSDLLGLAAPDLNPDPIE
jgi:hypothetical protein